MKSVLLVLLSVLSLNVSAQSQICDSTVSAVVGALANCWNSNSRGCVAAVAQSYSTQLMNAGRQDPTCRAQVEHACRAECYPRFPSDCNKSCAHLASYVP